MQNEIFTLGIGKVIAGGYAMRHCISFLKTAYLKPLAWIKKNGIKYGKVIYINYEPRDQWLENAFNQQFNMRTDKEISDALWNDDDSAEEQEDYAQWYRERAQDFEFHPFTYECNMCFQREAHYIGVTVRGTPFGFCRQCRDELQALKIE